MMHMTEKIAREESTYERALLTAAKAVTGDRAAKVVLITGGSCAGKTTTTKKLSQYIRDAGRRCHTVSIDDFYKNPDDVPLDENGRRDLEGIESIDLAYLHECLEQLAAGREARIPRFDFMLKKRADDYTPITLGDGDVAVIDLIGRCGMDYTPDNPFQLVERILRKIQTKLILVELHAEATSEKLAMGRMLDGQVSAVWGTHTHVPTADTMILPQGTGYVTDLGMTGPRDSVLGIRPELSIRRFRGDLPSRYEPAPGPCKLEACLFTIDDATGRCTAVRRVDIHG